MRYLVALAALLVTSYAQAANYYRVRVTRDDQDVYNVENTKLVVQTNMCFQFAFNKPAMLVWEYRGSYSNKLVFLGPDGKSQQSCRIKRLLVETAP